MMDEFGIGDKLFIVPLRLPCELIGIHVVEGHDVQLFVKYVCPDCKIYHCVWVEEKLIAKELPVKTDNVINFNKKRNVKRTNTTTL
ncbi:hypothetical protein EKK58_09120 [Candidatus Dependentiae bacterium]|nr:MAG: hypothetical protein EKK58_09120 [Candidatus Dependentiae bacterium]